MNGPPRLLDTNSDDFEEKLLRAADQDIGSDAGFRNTLSAMGAAAAVGSVASSGAAGAASSAKATGTAVGSTASGSLGSAVLLKWMGLGVLAGSVVVGTAQVVSPGPEPATSVVPSTGQALGPRRGGPQPFPSIGLAEVVPSAPDPSESAPMPDLVARQEWKPPQQAEPPRDERELTPPQEPTQAPGAGSSPISAPSTLQAEVAVLDHARQSIANRNPAMALQELDYYQRRFPAGLMAHEALVLRVQSLLQQGNRPAAADLACRFVTSQPASPHAAVLRHLVPECSISK